MRMPSLAEFLAPRRPKPLPPIDVAAVRIRLRMTQALATYYFTPPVAPQSSPARKR